MSDELFMREALLEAQKAFEIGEIPVGAVIVKDGEIIARAHNRRESEKNPLLHAEVAAMNEAAELLDSWNLEGCTLYVTLEPCPMCAGAAIMSHLSRVVFGADSEGGACGSVCNLFAMRFGFSPTLKSGVKADECGALLSAFFKKKRGV